MESLSNEVFGEVQKGLRCAECHVKLGEVEPVDDHRFCILCVTFLERDGIHIDQSRVATSIYLANGENHG